MSLFRQIAISVLATACTTPNPNYCRNHNCLDAEAGRVIRVSVTGDDAADGMAAPVKTLKHAIELATSNGAINTISLDVGRYSAANGETYPYTIPANVTIRGATGTVLAGTSADDGLIIETGTLDNIELDDFKTAVHAKIAVTVTDVTVKTSSIGVLADGEATVIASRFTFAGTNCPDTGLWAKESSQISVDTFVATGSIAVNVADQASGSIANSSLTDAPACTRITATGKSLAISNTQIIGGGVDLEGLQLEVTLDNTTIADTSGDAIQGRAHVFRMTGGELRNNGRGGAEVFGGVYTFTNVGIKGNPVFGIYLQSGTEPGTIAMHGCAITGNGSHGVYLFAGASGDFGTAANPGNNTFRNNAGVGLNIDTNASAVTAVGNIWTANVQGADSDGKYPAALKTGGVAFSAGNNYAFQDGSTLQL